MYRQKGLSLVELMVAITVGLILIAGVIQVFLSSRAVYSSQSALALSQENGRLATEFLSRDIRMAGYLGCASANLGSVTNTLNNASDFLYRFGRAVEGYEFGGTVTLPAGVSLNPAPNPNTDMLVLRGAFNGGLQVVDNNSGAQLFPDYVSNDGAVCPGNTNGYSGLCEQDILVVSDCAKSRIFQATNVQVAGSVVNVAHSGSAMTPGNAVTSWGGSSAPDVERFGADSEILKLSTIVYYISTSATTGRSGLWQQTNNGTPIELIEGVQDMRLSFGRDTDGDGVPNSFSYASAITASGWDEVVAVRAELLMQSNDNNVVPDPQPYTFDGVAVTPTDRHLRHVFFVTTGIRSRLD